MPGSIQRLFGFLAPPKKSDDKAPPSATQAQSDGKFNYNIGMDITKCPHDAGTDAFYAWIDGWNANAWKDAGSSPPPPDKPKGVLG